MKSCPNCHANFDDTVTFCSLCGTKLADAPETEPAEAAAPAEETVPPVDPAAYEAPQQPPYQPYQQPGYQPPYGQNDPQQPPYYGYQQYPPRGYPQQPAAPSIYDHTAEFEASDVSENKLFALLLYLLDIVGIVVVLLARKESPFLSFHLQQALKLEVVELALGVVSLLLCWTIVVPFAGTVCMVILQVLRIIAFCQVCGNKSKEPAILRDLSFLK